MAVAHLSYFVEMSFCFFFEKKAGTATGVSMSQLKSVSVGVLKKGLN